MQRRTFSSALVLFSCGLLATAAAAAPPWPARPVTLVVGTPAGGAVDAYARALADQLARQTGGTFLVENKPGANGNPARGIAAESERWARLVKATGFKAGN